MTVWFIGAGPGNPDLLTIRGRDIIACCPVCLYAGSLVPEAVVAHIGLRRNHETLLPEVYYPSPPVDFSGADTIVLDPMLATGGSAIEATRILKKQNASSLRFACLIAAPEGVASFEAAHPDVPLFTAALDRCLDRQGYICPGLGDAGDRSFGTV